MWYNMDTREENEEFEERKLDAPIPENSGKAEEDMVA